MGKVELPYVNSYKDRHGKWRHYYRRNGLRVPLSHTNLAEDYARVHASFTAQPKATGLRGSFGELVQTFYSSGDLKQLKDSTKVEYRRLIDKANAKWRDVPLEGITRKALLAYRDKLAATPVTANNLMRVLSTLLTFGVDRGLIKENPIRDLKKLKVQSEGWRPWTEAEVEVFTTLAEGAPRIAFMLALYTGQRRGDLLKLRWDQIRDGKLTLVQGKTQKPLVLPLHAKLQRELELWKAARKITGTTVVHRENGQPYTDDGFGTIWTREQNRLGVKAPFHGLRKNATIALIEAGCTVQEAQAITGHATLNMLSHYAQRADQERLAQAAMKKLETNE
jgi:integrase